MLVKFIEIGKNRENFDCIQDDEKITYDWLKQKVRPYILSSELDFEENAKGDILIYAGFYNVGKIKILPEGGK